jgi:hypothetical protein
MMPVKDLFDLWGVVDLTLLIHTCKILHSTAYTISSLLKIASILLDITTLVELPVMPLSTTFHPPSSTKDISMVL